MKALKNCLREELVEVATGARLQAAPQKYLNKTHAPITVLKQVFKFVGTKSPPSPSETACALLQKHRWILAVGMIFVFASITAGVVESPEASGTLLLDAVRAGNEMAVKDILKQGANVNEVGDQGLTALQVAASLGRTRIAEILLDKGGDPNQVGWMPFNSPPLFEAAAHLHTDTVNLLLERGANIGLGGKSDKTLMFWAASHGRIDTLTTLLARGANVNERDKKGWTPLMSAVHDDQVRAAEFLLERGADVNAKQFDNGWTPLMETALRGNSKTARVLIKGNANLNARNVDDETALKYARMSGKGEIVRLLQENGGTE